MPGNAIPRIRVPIVAKRPVQQKIYREEVPIQEQVDERQAPPPTTRRPPPTPPQQRVVQNFQDEFNNIPVVRQPVHTPIIPKTPQVFRKEEVCNEDTENWFLVLSWK